MIKNPFYGIIVKRRDFYGKKHFSDLERSYAAQTASMQGMNAIQSQLAQCCCDNRAATADVKYTIASEACNTRATDTQNTQGILNAINGGIRATIARRSTSFTRLWSAYPTCPREKLSSRSLRIWRDNGESFSVSNWRV